MLEGTEHGWGSSVLQRGVDPRPASFRVPFAATACVGCSSMVRGHDLEARVALLWTDRRMPRGRLGASGLCDRLKEQVNCTTIKRSLLSVILNSLNLCWVSRSRPSIQIMYLLWSGHPENRPVWRFHSAVINQTPLISCRLHHSHVLFLLPHLTSLLCQIQKILSCLFFPPRFPSSL